MQPDDRPSAGWPHLEHTSPRRAPGKHARVCGLKHQALLAQGLHHLQHHVGAPAALPAHVLGDACQAGRGRGRACRPPKLSRPSASVHAQPRTTPCPGAPRTLALHHDELGARLQAGLRAADGPGGVHRALRRQLCRRRVAAGAPLDAHLHVRRGSSGVARRWLPAVALLHSLQGCPAATPPSPPCTPHPTSGLGFRPAARTSRTRRARSGVGSETKPVETSTTSKPWRGGRGAGRSGAGQLGQAAGGRRAAATGRPAGTPRQLAPPDTCQLPALAQVRLHRVPALQAGRHAGGERCLQAAQPCSPLCHRRCRACVSTCSIQPPVET